MDGCPAEMLASLNVICTRFPRPHLRGHSIARQRNVIYRENLIHTVFSIATIIALVGCCSGKTSDQKVFKPYEYTAKPQTGPRVIIVRPRE